VTLLESSSTRLYHRFDCLSELTDSLAGYTGKDFDNADKWHGGVTLHQAIELATRGWPEGLRQLQTYDLQEFRKETMCLPAPVHACSGAYVDIDRYLDGSPECMLEYTLPTESRFCHIFANMSVGNIISTNAIFYRGYYLASMIDSLESKGIRTKVTLGFGGEDGNRVFTTLTAKDYQHVLDGDNLIFVMAHPAMLRHIVFSHWIKEGAEDLVGPTLGYPLSLPDDFPLEDPPSIMLPVLHHSSETHVRQAMEAELKKYLDHP